MVILDMDTNRFLSCDWGTSSFRLRLVEVNGFKTIAQEKCKEGSSATFEKWQQSGQREENRYNFYLDIIRNHLEKLQLQLKHTLDNVPLIISGMASSSIGMLELPYKEFPFSSNGSDLQTHVIPPNNQFKHTTILISGAKTDDDVMRGEEVQLVGSEFAIMDEHQLFLHPGTHSKHVMVKNGNAVSLKTYMTGELFSLLSTKSILAASVENNDSSEKEKSRKAFEQGVKQGFQGNLLHEMFMVRTNNLMEKITKEENWHYLSGLLIGNELYDFPNDFSGNIILAGEPVLTDLYIRALNCLGISERISSVQIKAADEITLKGQFEVFKRIEAIE